MTKCVQSGSCCFMQNSQNRDLSPQYHPCFWLNINVHIHAERAWHMLVQNESSLFRRSRKTGEEPAGDSPPLGEAQCGALFGKADPSSSPSSPLVGWCPQARHFTSPGLCFPICTHVFPWVRSKSTRWIQTDLGSATSRSVISWSVCLPDSEMEAIIVMSHWVGVRI